MSEEEKDLREEDWALFEAIRGNDIAEVRRLLDSGVDSESKDRFNRIRLMVACIKHNIIE